MSPIKAGLGTNACSRVLYPPRFSAYVPPEAHSLPRAHSDGAQRLPYEPGIRISYQLMKHAPTAWSSEMLQATNSTVSRPASVLSYPAGAVDQPNSSLSNWHAWQTWKA